MQIEYTPWPELLANLYRERGYWQNKPLTVLLHEQLPLHSNAIAVADTHKQLTYNELNTYSDNLAAYLQEKGIKAGDTALLQLGNQVEFYICFFAFIKVGAAPVCALFSHKNTELQNYCEILQPRVVIASSAHPLFGNEQFITKLHAIAPSIRETLIDHPKGNSELKQAYLQARYFKPQTLDPTAVAFFQLSGGSTGTPKLIPRTHNDYLYSVIASKDICQLNADHRYLCALPAAHNFPLSSPGALGVFSAGGTVVLANDPSPTVCFPLIEKYQITHTALVPPALQLWLQFAPQCQHNLTSLEVIQVGGAKLSLSLAEQVRPILGCQLQQVFGMAEGLVNYTRYDDDEFLVFHTQGRPICPDDEIKILDEDDQPVAPGEEGRLLTRGPYTFRGYYQAVEQNLAAFDHDGFYRSGDLVKQLPSGHLIVTGRVKDQINRGGEKIAAEEVENLLLQHPEIIHVAIVSMQDALLGEKSCAFIAGNKLSALMLRKFLRAQGIADFKVPDKFVFLSSLPLTAVGKTDKKALRTLADSQ